MRTLTHSINMPRLRRLALAAVVSVISSAPALLPQSAAAIPKSCVIRSYFNNAEHESQVGMRSSCPGAQRWGKVTKFVEAETVDLVPEGPGGPGGGPGKLPCEFLASGCSNLPEIRHN